MTVYQNSTANLGVKLEITHASPDVANNRTTITYKAWVYKTGSHNPRNELSDTPMYLTINGQSLVSTKTGNYNLTGSTTSQLIKSGTLTIPHNADGSKSFTFSWNVNFTSTNFPYQDFGYRSVTTSGTYVLPNIARASTFTIPSTTITTGSAFTVTINKASDGFRHKVAYIVGSSENEWTTNADKTYSATIPHSLFNAHKSAASVSGVIRVTTMNGSVEVGSNQRAVTINLASTAIPTLAGVSYTNSNKGMFTGTNQFIRNVSLPTITAGTAKGSYSSTIASYEFQTLRNTSTVLETISKTANSQQFGAFNFPTSGSEAKVYMQARVRDSRGRYSAWVKTPELRVHHYAPPAIGTMTVKRTGSGNTTLQVNRNYSITLMYEGGGGSNLNTASLRFQHRTAGTTGATDNTGAKSTTTSLSNSNANLSGTFAANTSYEVRAILSDKLNTVYGSWIRVGTEFVPMDIGPMGIGVGKIHNSASYNLDVGSGGMRSDGPIAVSGSLTATSGLQGNHINITGDGGNVQSLNTLYHASSGLLIDICGHHTTNMITVYVKGNGYSGLPINSMFQTYHYDSVGNFLQTKQINFGYTMPTGVFFVHGTRIKLWIPPGAAYQTYTVTATGMNGAIYKPKLSNSAFPGSITYKSNCVVTKSWHSGNHGPGSLLNADMLDGKHATAFADFSYTKSGNYEVYQVGEMMIITGQKGTDTTVSEWTRDGSVTYPKAFSDFPRVSLTVTTFSTRDKATPYLYSNTKTGFNFSVWDNPVNGVRTVHFIAIGRKV